MKGSQGSQERPQVASSHQPSRLNKTQQPPQPKPEYLDNNYQVPKRPNLTDKHIPAATMAPRAGSTQKINYKVEDNMTNSKIHEAKKGLLLLKKKMSRNGMSRDKNERGSVERREPEVLNSKKTIAKQEEYYGYEKEARKPTPQMPQKKPEREEMTKKSPPVPAKSMEDKPMRKQPPGGVFVNAEEAPLNSNEDFMAILERQMAKEKAGRQLQSMASGPSKPTSYQENEEVELAECSRGCGRQFNVTIIQKHEKVCEKVFQSKRKVFNSASRRAPEVEDFKIPSVPPPIREEKMKNGKSVKAKEGKEGKVPKWKQESAAFRAGLKQGRGQELSAEQKEVTEKGVGMVQCGSCGRKFNEDVAKRHVPYCESKAKQMPKMNTSKKR